MKPMDMKCHFYAVIFDLDSVVIRTAQLHARAEMTNNYGNYRGLHRSDDLQGVTAGHQCLIA